MKVFLRLTWYFRLKWHRYAVAIAILLVVAGLVMVPPWLTGRVVDAAVSGNLTGERLGLMVGAIAGVALLLYGLRFWWRVFLYSASFELAAILRQRVYDHILRMSPVFFHRHRTGDLMARATNDVNAVEVTAGEGVLTLVDGAMTGVVVLAVLFVAIDWRLTLLALLPWPVMAYYMWRFGNQLHDAFGNAQACFSGLNDRVQETLSTVRLTKAFGRETEAETRFRDVARAASDANLQVAAVDAKYEPTIFLTIGSSFFLTVAGGAWLIHRGQMSVGELTSFTMYLGYLIWPMFAFGWLLNIVERGSAAYERIEQLLSTPVDLQDSGSESDAAGNDIYFRIRRFEYPGEAAAVLQDVEFSAEAGRTVGIVGETGAGKTTLMALLLRLYEHPDAQVMLGGRPVQSYTLEALRRAVAYVPQESFLFSTTVAENIALASPHADLATIREAARLASVDEDIMAFPEQYQTLVGERGVTLSGGQKQRIAIARALLQDAPVLVLDDALSAVDARTENRILEYLRRVRQQRTVLIVTHRLSAVVDADQVVVLQGGRVIEAGTHRKLIAEDGWYARTYRYQQLEQVVEEGR